MVIGTSTWKTETEVIVKSTEIPYRCAVYWKVDRTETFPRVIVYGLTGLIRLNRTASLIWLLSDGHHSVRQILRALEERFPGIQSSILQEELSRFLSQADSRGLLLRHWDPLQPYRVIEERPAV
jgi:hypothetical protein